MAEPSRPPRQPGETTAGDVRPVISLRDVVAVLGSFPALAEASLEVAEREILLLRGPNGAGKTSLLRVCAGLLPIVRGVGTVFGYDLATQRELIRPQVGLLGHQNGLYLDLTVRDNVRFWGATVGASDAEVDAAMQLMGVAGRLGDVPARQLSAGQRRRTAARRPRRPSGPAVAARRTPRRTRRRRTGPARRRHCGRRPAPARRSSSPATSSSGRPGSPLVPSRSSPVASVRSPPDAPTRSDPPGDGLRTP